MENLTGAELLIRSLHSSGVEFLFMKEHPRTGAIQEAALREGGLTLISPVSEASCVPMADGCTRYSGKPAAAVTAGGGHLMTQVMGVASAWADKSPVITIGLRPDHGEGSSPIFDREGWDQETVFTAITRWTATVREWDLIPEVIFRGMREAMSARCGPVHIEISESLLQRQAELRPETKALLQSGPFLAQQEAPPRGDQQKVKEAFDILSRAQRPLIVAGGGVVKAEAVAEINQLAQKLNAPITSTMGGMGAALPDNPVFMGAASYLSGEAFHTAIREADVVLGVGLCFSGLDGFGLPPLWSPRIKFIQVNVDPEDIAINPPAEVAIVGDARQVMKQMLDLAEASPPGPDTGAWLKKLKRLNQEHLDRIKDEASRPWELIHPGAVPPALYEVAGESDSVVVLDGGNTALWAGMLIPVPGPRRGFFPMGMGTLGLGIPVAIGVKAAAKDKPVIIYSGDGAFLYNIHELETIKKYDLPIVAVVLNDSAWNMIRAGQAMAGEVFGTDLPDQDYAAVAKSYGLEGKRITRIEELKPAFEQALAAGRPAVLEVVIDPDSLPDSLISFARVEFDGTRMPPAKLIKGLRKSSFKLDVRGRNLIKFIARTR